MVEGHGSRRRASTEAIAHTLTISLREERSRARRSTNTWADSQMPVAITPSLLLVPTYSVPAGEIIVSPTSKHAGPRPRVRDLTAVRSDAGGKDHLRSNEELTNGRHIER